MLGTEIEEERERDALRQRRRNEKAAAALSAADTQLEERERGRREEEDLVEAAWVADTQLRLSQLSYCGGVRWLRSRKSHLIWAIVLPYREH
jgi:hypothetical protein